MQKITDIKQGIVEIKDEYIIEESAEYWQRYAEAITPYMYGENDNGREKTDQVHEVSSGEAAIRLV